MKNKKIIILISLLIIILLGFILTQRSTLLKLNQEEVVIEYGQTYTPLATELINTDQFTKEDIQLIKINTTLTNEKEKDYPAVGEYELSLSYQREIKKIKIVVKDTTSPVIQAPKTMSILYGQKDYQKEIKCTDLSPYEVIIDDKEVNVDKVGVYTIHITATDIYENKTTQDCQVKVTHQKIQNSLYVNIKDYIPNIYVDLKYATTDNFTHQKIYDFTDAYLRYGTVMKLKNVQEELNQQGYSLLIWDAYRPFTAQKKLWEVVSNPRYVASPSQGPKAHNLGHTVDITLITNDGKDVAMPTEFDDFSKKADRDYSDISNQDAIKHSQLLEKIMKKYGFVGYKNEWWDYSDSTSYSYTEFEPE